MKPLTSHQLTAVLLFALFASSFAAEKIIAVDTTIIREKPYLIVTPQKPIAGRDSVIAQIILGTASNSCMAPTFSNLSFTIEQMLTVEPFRDPTIAHYRVKVGFTRDPVPPNKVCTMEYNPVDYGPRFMLGALKAGTYSVVQDGGATGTLVTFGEFSVVESVGPIPAGYTIKGTVRDDPYPMDRMSRTVAGAKLTLYPAAIRTTDTLQSTVAVPVYPCDSAFTDENGNYSFINVAGGPYRIICTHADYRTFALSAQISVDTVINFILLPKDGYAFAAITGQVTHARPMDSRPLPFEECTVTVSRYDPAITLVSGADNGRYGVITDINGRYTVREIPISANGEVWYVHAFKGDYSAFKRVALYNGRTDTADFFFNAPYENSASVNVDGVVFTTASDKFTYQESEPVRIRYSITNTTTSTKTFGPFGGCQYDLIVTGATDNEIYRASSRSACPAVVSEIVVDPGETVVYDFPAWYLSTIWQILSTETLVAPRSVTFRMAARLQGAKYDNTLVGVPVTIEFEPRVGIAGAARTDKHSGASFNAQKQLLTLNLDKSQSVAVAVYTLDGAVMPAHSMVKNLSAGMHTLPLMNVPLSRGCYIIGVKGANFEKRFSAVRAGR